LRSDNIYAIATAAAKKAGYSNFDKDSDGEEKREEIVLALKRRGMKKATYGANNDQARKVGQRTSVKRNPRLNPNKLGVSDIIKEKKERNNPRKKPNIVAQGREDDLYPTGSQFAADAGDKNPVSKKFDNEEEDNTHQLGVRRRDGETDKLSSPAGSTIQAEQVGAVSKAILKQGLLDLLLQKKEDDWPHKNLTREQAEKIANNPKFRSAADVTQTYIDEEEETQDDLQPHQKPKRSRHKKGAQASAAKQRSRNKRRRRGRNAQSTTVKDTIPSPEEKTETQLEFDDDVSEDRGDIHGENEQYEPSPRRGGSRQGSRRKGEIPRSGWNPDLQNMLKAREQGDGKGVDPTGKDPLRGKPNKTNERYANADMGAMSYMAKSHLKQQPVSYEGDREARIKATKDHFQHLLLKTPCVCEQRGVIMAIGMQKGIGDIARGVVGGVKGAFQGAKEGIQGDPSKRIGGREETTPVTPAKPKPRGQAGVDPNVTMRGVDSPAAQAKAARVSGANRYKDTPAGRAARARDPRDTSGDVKFMQQKDFQKSGSGAPLASAEKPVAVMAAEQSGMYSVDGKNLDIDPMANKAPQESVNQTDAATRKASVSTDNQGRNTYVQLEDEPTICSSKEVFNSILEKTYYDDQVLERYEDSDSGKTKKRSKRRNITNDIVDTAGQTTNKTRGI